jgi:hypothetical protein
MGRDFDLPAPNTDCSVADPMFVREGVFTGDKDTLKTRNEFVGNEMVDES